MVSFVVLLPVGLIVASVGALLVVDGPGWWWVWVAAAVVYGVVALSRMRSQ